MIRILSLVAAALAATLSGCGDQLVSPEQMRVVQIREEVRQQVTEPCMNINAQVISEDPGSRWFGADIRVIRHSMRGPYMERLQREIVADVVRAVWSLDDPADRAEIYAVTRDMCRASAMKRTGG